MFADYSSPQHQNRQGMDGAAGTTYNSAQRSSTGFRASNNNQNQNPFEQRQQQNTAHSPGSGSGGGSSGKRHTQHHHQQHQNIVNESPSSFQDFQRRVENQEHTRNAVNFLTQSKDYRLHRIVSSQSEQFRTCFWLALIAVTVLLYLDLIMFLVQPSTVIDDNVYRHEYRPRSRKNDFFDGSAIGSMIRATNNVYVSLLLSSFVCFYVLPWTIFGVWSAADTDPTEHSFWKMAFIHVRAYLLLQLAAPYFGIHLDVPPFSSSEKIVSLFTTTNNNDETTTENSSQSFIVSILTSSAVMKSFAAFVVPISVTYFMFYKPFCKFWQKKTVVRIPWLIYSFQFGVVLLLSWWFVGTAAMTKTIDGTLQVLFEKTPKIFFSAMFHNYKLCGEDDGIFSSFCTFSSSSTNHQDASFGKQSQQMVIQFCSNLYTVMLSYSLCLWFASWFPNVSKIFDALTPSSVSSWGAAIVATMSAAVFFVHTGTMTNDIAIGLIAVLIFLFVRNPGN